jgi:tripartite-type tricarboxylate transporter receptor subunit TctC
MRGLRPLAAESEPDGYTLLMAKSGAMVASPSICPKSPYQTLRDFAPVARTAMPPLAMVVNPAVPAAALQEVTVLDRLD